jgi:hypothetical protein
VLVGHEIEERFPRDEICCPLDHEARVATERDDPVVVVGATVCGVATGLVGIDATAFVPVDVDPVVATTPPTAPVINTAATTAEAAL